MPSDSPRNSHSASPASTITSAYTVYVPPKRPPTTKPMKTNALRMRIMRGLGFTLHAAGVRVAVMTVRRPRP